MQSVTPGSTVRVASILSATETQHIYGTVLSVAPSTPELDGADGEPTLSIVYFDKNTNPAMLGTPNWHQAFKRQANVAHATHADVEAGKRGIYWIDVVPEAADIHPLPDSLPALTTGVSSVFSREKATAFFDERNAISVPKKIEPVIEEVPTTKASTPAVGTDAAPATTPEPESTKEQPSEPAPVSESATDSTSKPTEASV